MKRYFIIFLSLIMVLTLAACSSSASIKEKTFSGTVVEVENSILIVRPADDSDEIKSADRISVSDEFATEGEKPMVGDVVEIEYSGEIMETYPAQLGGVKSIKVISHDESFDDIGIKDYMWQAIRVNWSDNVDMLAECLNPDTMAISSVRHLPVYKINSKEELDNFKTKYGKDLGFDSAYSDTSFNDAVKRYNDDYFGNSCLMLIYISSGSGSERFALKDVVVEKDTFCLDVEQANRPEVGTTDMAAWFIIVEVDNEDVSSISNFDAVFND